MEVETGDQLLTYLDENEQLDPVEYMKKKDEFIENVKKKLIRYAPIRYEGDKWIIKRKNK